MDTRREPESGLAEQLESIRRQIVHLQSLAFEHPNVEAPTISASESEAKNAPRGMEGLLIPELPEDGPFGMALVDKDSRLLRANRALYRMLDRTDQELKSGHFLDVTQENERHSPIQQVLEGSRPFCKVEKCFEKESGESLWLQLTAFVVPDCNGKPNYRLIIVEDVDNQKRSEIALTKEKQLLERLINSSVDGIFAFDRNCVFTVWNRGMERIFGIGAKDTLGRPAFQACPFLNELGENANFAAALRGEKVISRDKRYVVPGTGGQGYFEGYYSPMYDSSGVYVVGGLAVVRDVTERRLAEEGKRISEERYRELFENAYDMIFTLDLTGRLTSVNRAAERITGYPRAEALQMRFTEFVAPESQKNARMMSDHQLMDEVPTTQELEIVSKDGRRITLEVNSRLTFREGKPIGVQGIARDVTHRKKAEADLQEAKRKLEAWIRELEQRTREMTVLSEMGDILRACLTAEEAYEVIVRVAQQIFPVQGGALYVIGPSRSIVESVAEWGGDSLIERTFTTDECWSLRRGRVHWVEDTQTGLLCKHLQRPPPKGYLCVPMMAQSEALGVLHLTQLENVPMPEAKQRLAMAMAEHVAMALSNLKLHETLRSQSIRDQLTGLFNRSFMEEALELELRRAMRNQHQLSVIMLDLDDLQLINENHGADAGDVVLREMGMLLQGNVRKGDIACRCGPQRFVVILPQGSLDISRQRAENLRELVRILAVNFRTEKECHVTVSVGLAVFPDHGRTVDALLRAAEAALHRAKSAGGNCVVTAN